MKTYQKLALAVLAGVSIGIAGAKVIHAQQTKTPPGYVISEVDAMDLAAMQKYVEKVSATRWRLSITTMSLLACQDPGSRWRTTKGGS